MIAASVWMALSTVPVRRLVLLRPNGLLLLPWVSAQRVRTGRFSAETMPLVTVADRPSGLPIAHRLLADRESAGGAQRGRGQPADAVHLDHGEVAGGVGADQRRPRGGAVVEADREGGGALDDVVVGQDVAVGGEDDARALTAGGRGGGDHGDDARQHGRGDGLDAAGGGGDWSVPPTGSARARSTRR